MKRTALPSLFVLLLAVLCFGRTASDEDTANALKGVLRLQESLRNPESLQISRAVVTNKGVCIEYRSRNGSSGMASGFAVYKADKDLVWVDNSWLWDQVCLAGKYGQRRDGKDVTDAVRTATDSKQASEFKGQLVQSAPLREDTTAPAVQLVVRAARVESLVRNNTAPVAAVAPKAAVSGQMGHAVPLPTSTTPAPTAQAAVPVPGGTPPKPVAVAVPVPAPLAAPHAVASAPVASVELGTIRGVTIVDNTGALDKKAPPPPPESLADAARRLRKAKQQ